MLFSKNAIYTAFSLSSPSEITYKLSSPIKSFKKMFFFFIIVFFNLISSSWSYVPEGVLRAANGELQVKRFTHPPGEQDFAWLIGDQNQQSGLHQADSQSSAVAQVQLPQTSSFQQPLTSSSETLAQSLNVYPQGLISQANQPTGKPGFDSGNHGGDYPLSYHPAIHLPQHGSWAESSHQPSDSMYIVQPKINQYNPHGQFVSNDQDLNREPGSAWTRSIFQAQSIEGANLPSRYLSIPGRNEKLVNEEVANNHFVKPSNIPNVFENSSTFSPRINAMYDTELGKLEPDRIQGFENRNLGELANHKKSTVGLPGAIYFHEDHLSHTNYSPEEFKEKNISSHPSPRSGINCELIHSPPHQVEENEDGNLSFFKNRASTPQGVVAQSAHNKNSEFTIGKTLEAGSGFYSSASNSPWSAIQQIWDLIPNVELHSNNLNSYSDNASLAQLRTQNHIDSGNILSSQEKKYGENIILMKEGRLRKKQKKTESSLEIKNLKDFTKKSDSYKKHSKEILETRSSNLNSQLSKITPTQKLNLEENKKLKNIIDRNSQENNKFEANTINKRKRSRKNLKNIVEKLNESGEKKAGSKKRNERTRYHQRVDSKIAKLGFFGRYHVLKRPSKFKAEINYFGELDDWEKNILKRTKAVVKNFPFFPESFSAARNKYLLVTAKSHAINNILYKVEMVEDNNNNDKRIQDLIMEDKFMFNQIFFEKIIEKIKRIDDIYLKSAILIFFGPIKEKLLQKKTDVFLISPVEVSSFFKSNVNLKIDLDKSEKLIKEEDSVEAENQAFELPDNILNWIKHLSKHSKSFQTNNFHGNEKSWLKRISVITDIRKRFLENSLTMAKALGDNEEEIINQFKKKRESAIEIIDDILMKVDFRSESSRSIKLDIETKASDIIFNKPINHAAKDLSTKTTENQEDKKTQLIVEKEELIKSLTDYFEKNSFVHCSRAPIISKIILYWLNVTHPSVLCNLNNGSISNQEKIFLSFWRRFLFIIRLLDSMKVEKTSI
ncbi:expressed protein [Phakopsora pachyrhizi]|uniref:Expressed protein n=1 Tax=Phakopsora pachyrhizi TaxID=170000 RepID=A0AAV0B9E2_PHAPC|nr:expressed protein [Phakopsora pachyrhizi]